ncbi:hypothetical protein Cgig2_003060 [Carnegiea gigantea]|uniref:Retrotransposon Copia-like N-terminal domain-containing protein n=1 Tax=Carnegiea gigantea TaxID=171969 RepID=A0A9Q1JSX9_9CARY|nr:hypothetical protein Cgig2_003060 [Carnegiea gigantea]
MSAERNRQNIGLSDLQNPLFLCPSKGPRSLAIQEKLIGAKNYRSWRRNVEIGLATKRKLGFVQGTVTRPTDDLIKAKMWDACNSMIIAWLMNSISESIGKSILFLNSAGQIRLQLEQRFALSNGSRKYKLNKDIYEVKQNHASISDYYTKLKCLWEDLEDMNELPKLSAITDEESQREILDMNKLDVESAALYSTV